VLALGAVCAPSASAASENVVIAEAYGGGGNSGAPYRSDFVELFNRSTAAVGISGWKIQYWSATGTSVASTATLPAGSTIAAGGRFLIKEADGANTAATPLPTPDATGTAAMSSSGARVYLLDSTGSTVDLLGWGSATASEGAPAGSTSNTTSVARANPCIDTDVSAADFTVGAPTPQNSSTPTVVCGDTPPDPVNEPERSPRSRALLISLPSTAGR